MSCCSIGSIECGAKPCPASQSSGTADGRVVTTYRALGNAEISERSQVSVRARSRCGTSSTPSTRTSARPLSMRSSTHPAGAESGTPEARRNSSGSGRLSAEVKARSRSTNGTHVPQEPSACRAAVRASHWTRVDFPEPAGPRSSTRSAEARACSARSWV